MNEIDEMIVYEIVNRIYYLKKRNSHTWLQLLTKEIQRRENETKKLNKYIKRKIKNNFDKKLTRKLSKLL